MIFVAGYTELLSKIFKNRIDITVAPEAVNTIRNLLPKLKDKDELQKKSNVVYEIPCAGCNNVYIRQT